MYIRISYLLIIHCLIFMAHRAIPMIAEGKFWLVALFLLYYTGGKSAQKRCTNTDHESR